MQVNIKEIRLVLVGVQHPVHVAGIGVRRAVKFVWLRFPRHGLCERFHQTLVITVGLSSSITFFLLLTGVGSRLTDLRCPSVSPKHI